MDALPAGSRLNDAEIRAGLAPTAGYRYADRARHGLFVAGQVPLDGAGRIVGVGDPGAQATACLRNLRTLLDVHGMSMATVRQIVVHVVGDRRDLLDAWASVVDWFDGCVPPATLLGVTVLGHAGQLVEIDATVADVSQ